MCILGTRKSNSMFKFYIDVTKFSLAFCIVLIPLAGILPSIITFGVLGTPLGLLGYNQFHKNEYFTYYNLGFTKRQLILKTWLFNIILMAPLFLLYYFFAFIIKLFTI